MRKTKLTKKKLEEINYKGGFYSLLKSAEEQQSRVEGGIKFNYSNIVNKLEPEFIDQIMSKVRAQIRREDEIVKYPFGGGPSNIGVYLSFDPPGTNLLDPRPDFETYKYPPNNPHNPNREIGIMISKFLNLEKNTPNKLARDRINLLFKLNELESHIKNIIKEIEKSELRNYVGTHSTKLFKEEAIFKIYGGQEQVERLRAESAALDFFQKELPDSHTPRVYCHGGLGDFYVLLEEKIEGMTLDGYLKKSKRDKQRNKLLEHILDEMVRIGIEGYTNDIPTLYGKLTEKSISEWLDIGIVNKLNTEQSKDLLQKIKSDYGIVSRLLLESPFLYNKDIPTKNWLVKKEGNLCAIDFENTHFGPIQLDLVTLFEGRNGFELKERELTSLLKRICEKINSYIKKKNKNLPEFEEQDFIKTYFAASVHRNLSMAGTNKEQNNQKQTIKHLKRAMYSANKLQRIVKNENEKEGLQRLSNSIYKLQLVFFNKD